MAFLESLGEPNLGRSVDRLVDMYNSMIVAIRPDLRSKFQPLAPIPKQPVDRN